MVDMCKTSYLLAGVIFLTVISSLNAMSDMDEMEEPEGPLFAQPSHLQISTINPASFEFRTVRDPRQIAAASAHGVMNTRHIESLFNSFPGFNREPERSELSVLMSHPSKKTNKKKRPTIGQIITKIIQLRGMTRAEDYPKIFRFTKSRISLEELDRKKKMSHGHVTSLERGDGLDPKDVPRSSMLIIPGGIYDRSKPLTTNSGHSLPRPLSIYSDSHEPYDHKDISF